MTGKLIVRKTLGASARRFLVRMSALALVLPCANRALAESDQPNTKLAVVDDSFDWGFAPRHAALTRTFWLKPATNDTVRIFDVVPGCSCTKSPLEKKIIPPGDSARLEIILNTGAYRGRVHKRPQIQVDGELYPHVLKVWTNATADTLPMPRLELEPRRLDVAKGKTELSLTLQNKTDSAISLKMIELWPERLEVSLPKSLAPGARAKVKLKLRPPQKGWFQESFTFSSTTSGGEELRFTIPVSYGDIPQDSTKAGKRKH